MTDSFDYRLGLEDQPEPAGEFYDPGFSSYDPGFSRKKTARDKLVQSLMGGASAFAPPVATNPTAAGTRGRDLMTGSAIGGIISALANRKKDNGGLLGLGFLGLSNGGLFDPDEDDIAVVGENPDGTFNETTEMLVPVGGGKTAVVPLGGGIGGGMSRGTDSVHWLTGRQFTPTKMVPPDFRIGEDTPDVDVDQSFGDPMGKSQYALNRMLADMGAPGTSRSILEVKSPTPQRDALGRMLEEYKAPIERQKPGIGRRIGSGLLGGLTSFLASSNSPAIRQAAQGNMAAVQAATHNLLNPGERERADLMATRAQNLKVQEYLANLERQSAMDANRSMLDKLRLDEQVEQTVQAQRQAAASEANARRAAEQSAFDRLMQQKRFEYQQQHDKDLLNKPTVQTLSPGASAVVVRNGEFGQRVEGPPRPNTGRAVPTAEGVQWVTSGPDGGIVGTKRIGGLPPRGNAATSQSAAPAQDFVLMRMPRGATVNGQPVQEGTVLPIKRSEVDRLLRDGAQRVMP